MVALASPAQQDAIDEATELYQAKNFAAAAEKMSALVDPSNVNVDLSHTEWHTLLKFAARSYLELEAHAKAANDPEGRKLALNRGIKLCERYEKSVARNLSPDDPLASPRDCAELRLRLKELNEATAPPPEGDTSKEKDLAKTKNGQGADTDIPRAPQDKGERRQLIARQKVGVGFAGTGGLLLLTAGALGLATRSTGQQYVGMSCADTYHPDCMDLYDRGRGLASGQWITLGIGGAFALTGILLAAIPPRPGKRTPEVQPVMGPKNAGFVLRWAF